MNEASCTKQKHPPIWIDVTTLIHWNRPAVGIVRVEQQLCLWLLEQEHQDIRFCRYDRARQKFHEVDRAIVSAHLRSLAAIVQNAPTPATHPSPLNFEQRLRNRVLTSLDHFPPRLRAMALKGLIRIKPFSQKVIQRARDVRARLKRRNAIAPQPALFAPIRNPALDMPTGSVYVSLGLDWDYKDMAHLYRLKREKNLKYLLFCYDIIPILQPHLCVGDVSRQFAHYFADLAWCADLILCISESSRHDLRSLLKKLNVPQPDMRVIQLGSDILPSEDSTATISSAVEHMLEKRFLLFVSTIERRKNHEVLYRAYTRLAQEGVETPDLVFVGMPGWGTQELLSDIRLDPRTQGRIHILNHVSDAELATLYRHAEFTVYPSLYEGWGLPVAESLAYGKFCLSSNTSSLPEVGGNWVEHLDPWDLPAWVERLRHYLTHPEEIQRRNTRIAAEYRPHPWRETAADIYAHARRLQQQP